MFDFVGNEKVIETLIQNGANINMTNQFNETLLHVAATKGERSKLKLK